MISLPRSMHVKRNVMLLANLVWLAIALPTGFAAAQDQPASAAPQQQLLDAGQLDQLVAPIALYSDPLLAQVLMASTYPLEIVQADRFAKANKSLTGDKLTAALDQQDWGRLRPDRHSSRVWQFRHHDFHGQSRRDRAREGSRA